MYMCILSQAVLIMHNPAWAVLMFKTLAKREKKTTTALIYSFVSASPNKNKLKGKIRIEQGREKKNLCWTTNTSGQERSVVCACALNTEHRPQ